ncbi:hypothetical protein TCON_1021 [Astathelohania contejeani]|uniref:Uncharacterized protein n=1 Tax=Astathelohania contejeani TaxID=164912 RepID=A0ABQ7HZZ1_9MICR|nr:hypothetical protein TCON_1021 [Thelohania contejeani]
MIFHLSFLNQKHEICISSLFDFELQIRREIEKWLGLKNYRWHVVNGKVIEVLLRLCGGEKRKFEKRLVEIGKIMEKNVKYLKKTEKKSRKKNDNENININNINNKIRDSKEEELINQIIENIKNELRRNKYD